MNRRNSLSADRLLGEILRSVSRSFYLSIRMLPRGLREPVGLAYLLARATDTVADTTDIPPAVRKEKLAALVSAIQENAGRWEIPDLQASFVPRQTNAAERRLIESLPDCLDYLARLNPADRADIQVVLGKITRAQMLDVERFGTHDEIGALATASDLKDYTYLIAGCVGEFWTQLCFRHVRDFAEASVEKMMEWGREYGTGLQLINILRDTGADLRAGRCYFPMEELNAAGLKPSEVLNQPERFAAVFQKWIGEAERGLRAGMEYVHAIRNRRIRGATALPVLIGARTLALLRAASGSVFERKIKISRAEVRAMIASVAMTLASRKRLDAMFAASFR